MPAFQTIRWSDEKVCAIIIDQTLLPQGFREIEIATLDAMFEAIKQLKVRGAPAIGVAAAYGVVLGLQNAENVENARSADTLENLKKQALAGIEKLASSRPTAVNLFWALDRMRKKITSFVGAEENFKNALLDEAKKIHAEDAALCERISENGAALIKSGMRILTHCNAGALATAGRGTAVGVITKAFEQGKKIEVFVDETRPLLQGARLTAWELSQANIPYTLITDNMSAHCFQQGFIDAVIVGADRIAGNGDTANKIGTLNVAILAKHFSVPFYVAAPFSTFDLKIQTGAEIPIEQRNPAEIKRFRDAITAPENAKVYNPAFDVTPAEFISAFITEAGVIKPPFAESIKEFLGNIEQ